jgi:hypothetical protein
MTQTGYTSLIVTLCTLCALLGPALALATQASARTAEAGAWLLIGPPGADLAAIAEAAGGWAIGFEQAPLAILAAGPANFDTLSEAQGAWMTIKAGALADMCGVSYETTAG